MGIQTSLTCPRGQRKTWVASYAIPTAITGRHYTFTVRDLSGNSLFQLTTGSGITITDDINGIMEITATATQTLIQAQNGNWDLWQTDTGSEDQIGYGQFIITPSYRL